MARFHKRQEEDALTFGGRLRFVHIDLRDDDDDEEETSSSSSLPWPCLQFANIVEMLSVLQSQTSFLQDRLSCPHMLHRINVEFLRHLQDGGHENDQVVFLFGNLTPQGNRLIFDHSTAAADVDERCMASSKREDENLLLVHKHQKHQNRRPRRRRPRLQVQDYKEGILAAVDQLQGEPCFMNALNETSPILAALLAEEMLSPNRMPGPGEHAPAA